MDKNTKKNGLINFIALLVAGGAAAFLAQLTKSWTAEATLIFYLLGVLVAAVSYFQMRLEESERFEKLEYDELNKNPGGSALFTSDEADVLPARRSREQFEKWFVPIFTLLLMGLQGGAVYWLWQKLSKATPVALGDAKLALALYGISALILFLLGKYSAGLARLEGQRLLRPGSSYLLLGAYLNFLSAVCIAAAELGFPNADLYVARVVVVVVGVGAVESMASVIFEIYRPRVKGRKGRLLYDSRLTGLLSQPEGLFTTAAHALDYQFGFKVSETWFYRFLERAFAWIVLSQLGILWLSTAFVIIEPQEQALLERFGKPLAGGKVLDPGLHFKLPWPVDKVYRYPTREVQSFIVGVIPDPEMEKEHVLVWTKSHNKEEYNMVVATAGTGAISATTGESGKDQAVPVSLLSVSIPVQYQITNLLAWAYNHADAPQLLEGIANREVVRYLINVDLDDIMGAGRMEAANTMRERIQAHADAANLGAHIVFVGLQDIHPPLKVAKDYEEVISAMQEKETNRLAALAYQATIVPVVRAAATNIITKAQADRLSKVATVKAEATLFTNQIVAFNTSPSVYTNRAYLEAIGRAAAPARKYLLDTTNKTGVIQFNLEDKLDKSMLDVPMPELKKN